MALAADARKALAVLVAVAPACADLTAAKHNRTDVEASIIILRRREGGGSTVGARLNRIESN